jgi:hypothetical protein
VKRSGEISEYLVEYDEIPQFRYAAFGMTNETRQDFRPPTSDKIKSKKHGIKTTGIYRENLRPVTATI